MAQQRPTTQPGAAAAPQPFASAIEALRWAFAAVPRRHNTQPRPCRPVDVLRAVKDANTACGFARPERLLILRAAFGRLNSREAASPAWLHVQHRLTQHLAARGLVRAA
jgi:hypothetical protein